MTLWGRGTRGTDTFPVSEQDDSGVNLSSWAERVLEHSYGFPYYLPVTKKGICSWAQFYFPFRGKKSKRREHILVTGRL